MKARLLGHIKDAYELKLREAVRNRVASHSKSACHASLGLMHMAREMYNDIMHMETVEIREEFFNKTLIPYLMLGTGETPRRNERVHAIHENHPQCCFNGSRYRVALILILTGQSSASRT